MTREIFVFGSNLAGRHGVGAAKTAMEKHGAVWGQAEGLQGQSYAIPTRGYVDIHGGRLYTLSLSAIQFRVNTFLAFAAEHPELTFNVTRIGCGLAGYKDAAIAPLFADAPPNVRLPQAWGGDGFDW